MKVYYGWIVVAAGALMGCVAMGAMFSLAVFLQPMSETTGWSRTGISGAMTLDFLTMGFAAFGWGALTDRFGPRPVVLAGAVLLTLGLALSSRATTLLEFQIVYGVIVGVAAGAIIAPMMATTTGWFEKNRSLAVSMVSAGMGMAPMTISPVANWTYGGVMPLYSVIAREYFPMRIMGTMIGGASLVASLGMALGPALGGWIFDQFGTYGWLYIGSFAVGLGATAIALAFPPVPSRQQCLQAA